METDDSLQGLGAVLSQLHGDVKLHPVSLGEKNYGITKLETLAVGHFRAYLYESRVTVSLTILRLRVFSWTPLSQANMDVGGHVCSIAG